MQLWLAHATCTACDAVPKSCNPATVMIVVPACVPVAGRRLQQCAHLYEFKTALLPCQTHADCVVRLLTARRLQQRAHLYEYEMAMLANLAPEKVAEAMELIPTLKVRCDRYFYHAVDTAHACLEDLADPGHGVKLRAFSSQNLRRRQEQWNCSIIPPLKVGAGMCPCHVFL